MPARIDFITKLTGLEFQSCYSRTNYLNLDGQEIPFLHINDLVTNKLLTDRSKDAGDADELQKIMRVSGKHEETTND